MSPKILLKMSLKYWFLFAMGGIEEYKFPSLLLPTLAAGVERARTVAA